MANEMTMRHNGHRRIKRALAAAALGLVLLPAPSLRAEVKDGPSALPAAARSAKISPEEARQAALKTVPGEVTDTTVEKKLGKMVYVIEIVAQNGGEETDVLVDMDSGKVLGVEK